MKITRQGFGTERAYVTVFAPDNTIRHLRRFLHLEDDAPLVVYGGMKMVSSGYGWYRIDAYNPRALGKDLEFALERLEACLVWMQAKLTSEVRCLVAYGVQGADHIDRDAQRKAFEAIQADRGVRKDVAVLQENQFKRQRAEAKPASADMLQLLASRVNGKFHRTGA